MNDEKKTLKDVTYNVTVWDKEWDTDEYEDILDCEVMEDGALRITVMSEQNDKSPRTKAAYAPGVWLRFDVEVANDEDDE